MPEGVSRHFSRHTPRFQAEVKDLKGVSWFGPSNCTDVWQPVDAGFGKMLKTLIFQEQDDCMARD